MRGTVSGVFVSVYLLLLPPLVCLWHCCWSCCCCQWWLQSEHVRVNLNVIVLIQVIIQTLLYSRVRQTNERVHVYYNINSDQTKRLFYLLLRLPVVLLLRWIRFYLYLRNRSTHCLSRQMTEILSHRQKLTIHFKWAAHISSSSSNGFGTICSNKTVRC